MSEDICGLIVVLVLSVLWLVARLHHRRQKPPDHDAATLQRLLKPRTPHDCPACRWHNVRPRSAAAPPPPPWRELKSSRGAPRRIVTDGFACPNAACAYYRITDATVHALSAMALMASASAFRPFAVRRAGRRSVPAVIPHSSA